LHPIEHLRYVARAGDADPVMIATETATAMRHLDSSGLVVAARRVLQRHPTNGPLWWVCSHLVTAPEHGARVLSLVDELDDDATSSRLAGALADDARVLVTSWAPTVAAALRRRGDVEVTVCGRSYGSSAMVRSLRRDDLSVRQVDIEAAAVSMERVDVVLLEAGALSWSSAVAALGSAVLAAVARAFDVPVWLVAGRGRRLPEPYLEVMGRSIEATDEPDHDRLDPRQVAAIIGPAGRSAPDSVSLAAECPLATELVASLR